MTEGFRLSICVGVVLVGGVSTEYFPGEVVWRERKEGLRAVAEAGEGSLDKA